MHNGLKTRNGDKPRNAGVRCNPGGFQKMFEEMDKCCTAPGGSLDCSTIMKHMKGVTKNQPCCKTAAGKTK